MYTTEQKLQYRENQITVTPQELEAQKQKQLATRSHNFEYGKEPSHFVTMNNATYNNPALNGENKNAAPDGSEIRKTHFSLGSEPVPMRTIHQIEFPPKKSDGEQKIDSKEMARGFQATNFLLGDDRPDKISSSHIHYHNYGMGEQEKLNAKQKGELRATHF